MLFWVGEDLLSPGLSPPVTKHGLSPLPLQQPVPASEADVHRPGPPGPAASQQARQPPQPAHQRHPGQAGLPGLTAEQQRRQHRV